MLVGALVHILMLDLVRCVLKGFSQVGESLLVVGDGALDLGLLDFEAGNLFTDFVVFVLLKRHLLLGFVVLLLDLAQLHGHLVDLLLVVLLGGSVVCWLQKRVLLNESVSTIVDLEFLLHDGAARACEIFVAGDALASVTVHSLIFCYI